jgi:hypothetical protein
MIVVPFVSVGPIGFGTSPDDVQKALGPPIATTRNYLGEEEFLYDGFNIEFGDAGMVEVTFVPSQDIVIGETPLMDNRHGRDDLLARSRERFRGNGSIVLRDLGVAIPDEDESPFPVTVFARGRMDFLLSTYERF